MNTTFHLEKDQIEKCAPDAEDIANNYPYEMDVIKRLNMK